MRPEEYRALNEYLKSLTGYNDPISAIHHVALHPGYDTVLAMFGGDVKGARENGMILHWNTDEGFGTSHIGVQDSQIASNNGVTVVAVFAYGNGFIHRDQLRKYGPPTVGVLDDSYKYEFVCDGEYGNPHFFFEGEEPWRDAQKEFANQILMQSEG